MSWQLGKRRQTDASDSVADSRLALLCSDCFAYKLPFSARQKRPSGGAGTESAA